MNKKLRAFSVTQITVFTIIYYYPLLIINFIVNLFLDTAPAMFDCIFILVTMTLIQGLFTWREEDPSTRKILEDGSS